MAHLTASVYNEGEKIWSGPKTKEIYSPEMTVGEVIVMQLRRTPNKIIQILESTGESLTAQEYLNYSMALARNLLDLSIKPGDIVGVYAKHSLHLVTVMLASFLCGTPVHGVFHGFEKDTITKLYETTRPNIIFCDEENYEKALYTKDTLQLDAKIVIMTGSVKDVLHIQNLVNTLREVAILSSSGTTGTPKGVLCSHQSMLHNVVYFTATMDSVFICFSTMYWASGVMNLLQSLLYSALRIVSDRPYNTEYFLDVVKRYKVTHVFSTGTQIADLVLNGDKNVARAALESIDTMMCGGTKIPQAIQDQMIEIFGDNTKRPGFVIGYGLSEIMGGNPEATAQAKQGKRIKTGDLGFFDNEGFLHLKGRAKEMFKWRGFQICPQPIEEVIKRIPGVNEVCVFPIPDLVAGNLTACAIVRSQDVNGQQLTAQMINEYLEQEMYREKIWSGPKTKEIYSPEMTVGEVIVMQLRRTPNKIIQILESTGESLTAHEYLNYSMALARNLLDLGIKPGDIVGLYAKHSLHLATVMLASFLCGTPVHGVFHGFEKDTITKLYETTRPKIIFCDEENYKKVLYTKDTLELDAKIVIMTGSVKDVLHIQNLVNTLREVGDLSSFPCTKLSSADTAAILCSSGTTGTPKGVLCSHQSMLHNLLYLTATMDSVLLCFSTMYWASGVMNLLQGLLYSALRIVPDRPYTPEYFLDVVKRYKVTHVFSTGAQIADLVLNGDKNVARAALESIDTLMCGGAKIPQAIQEQIIEIFGDNTKRPGFVIGYGLSEIMGGVSINGGYPFQFKAQTEGKLWPNREVCIVGEKGQRMGPNETGEVYVYSPYIWLGYYNNPEATAQAKQGKWIKTGDLGFFDNEGFLHLIGRAKEMFKWKNFQICPQPIEEVLQRIPGVAEVCVFPIPDLVAENLAACAIVKSKDAVGKQLTARMVNECIEQQMDSYYHLRGGVYFVDSLPRTDTGKVQRLKMAQLIGEIDR
ncbi:gramicidin S synthase 2-like [Musca vetustissima]|uniref:gramicidin S synthase 2-like n=1 Tax=Musca vetustissima TaxID=27455 RepID=UPI002AB6E54A|nr:gramicidin S synthase 2-like [Musca vetustissima]